MNTSTLVHVRPGGVMVRASAFDSRGREFDSRPFRCWASCSHTRGSGVALPLCHRLNWFIHLGAQADEQPAITARGYGLFTCNFTVVCGCL